MAEIYISAFTADFRHYDDLADWIAAFPELPIGAEMAVAWITPDFYELLEPQIPKFRELPITLHGPFMEMCTRPGSEEEQILHRQLELSCELYRRFDAKSIVLHTHSRGLPGEDPAETRNRVVQVLNHWIPVMTARGMAVTVENVGYPGKHNAFYTQEQFVQLFGELPEETGCLIDLGHALLNGWDIPGLIRRMGKKIRGYHIHTNDGISDSHIPIYAPGSILSREKMDEILHTIADVTPDAHLILEYSPNCGVTKEILHQDIRAIASVCGLLPG